MLVKQILTSDSEGNIYLHNEYNVQSVLDLARASRESGSNGWFGDKNGECKLIGFIPEELWTFNPWLIMAKRAQFAGDKGKHDYYMTKFFELFPAFKAGHKQKYWRGSRVEIL